MDSVRYCYLKSLTLRVNSFMNSINSLKTYTKTIANWNRSKDISWTQANAFLHRKGHYPQFHVSYLLPVDLLHGYTYGCHTLSLSKFRCLDSLNGRMKSLLLRHKRQKGRCFEDKTNWAYLVSTRDQKIGCRPTLTHEPSALVLFAHSKLSRLISVFSTLSLSHERYTS